jgi:hypothetical protein
MNIPAQSAPVSKGKWPRSPIVRTTLYDLAAANTSEVGADEDELAIAVVGHLLKTHRLTYLRPSKLRRSVTDQCQRIRRHRDTTASTAPSGGSRAVLAGHCLPRHGLPPGACLRSPIRGRPRMPARRSHVHRAHLPVSYLSRRRDSRNSSNDRRFSLESVIKNT